MKWFGFENLLTYNVYLIEAISWGKAEEVLKFKYSEVTDNIDWILLSSSSLDKLVFHWGRRDHEFQVAITILDGRTFHLCRSSSSPAKRVRAHDGEFCMACNEFVPMAEPNQPDDKFKCYKCRK